MTLCGACAESVQNLCLYLATNYANVVNGIDIDMDLVMNWFRSLDLHQKMSEMSENTKYRNEFNYYEILKIKYLKMKDL